MAEETTPTRQETVAANLQAVIDKYGEENTDRVVIALLKDINVSLAMLVDAGASSSDS